MLNTHCFGKAPEHFSPAAKINSNLYNQTLSKQIAFSILSPASRHMDPIQAVDTLSSRFTGLMLAVKPHQPQ